MVKESRSELDGCLNKAKDELPTTPSFLRDDACRPNAISTDLATTSAGGVNKIIF